MAEETKIGTTTVWARARLLMAAVAVAALAGRGRTAAVPPAVTWTENLSGALSRAGSEMKPVLLVFSSPGCPWCVRLKTETLAEKDVAAALEGFICVAVDTSRDPKTAQAFQIRGVPATVILSGDGRAQSFAEGFMDKAAFLAFLESYRSGGGQGSAAAAAFDTWIKALESKSVNASQWPEIMAGLGTKENRAPLHRALLAYQPCPRGDWVQLLSHPQLTVRLGALELLEELAGESYGYDPWADASANREPLARWRQWASGDTHVTQQVFAPLTEEQIVGYIRDLSSSDRERCGRAVRMLEQAGESVIPVLEAWTDANASAGDEALRQVREVRYFLLLPDILGAERGRIAHRLVFGTLDDRLRSLRAAAGAGERAFNVLTEFLADPAPLVRESAVDSLYAVSKERAYPALSGLLKSEKDEEVIHAVVRGASCLKGPQAVELVGSFLSHANEDLVVATLSSLGRTKSVKAATAVKACLKSPQWRVRAAALEALGKLKDRSAEEEICVCLEDADPFVRRTAVLTLAELSAKKSAKRMAAVFIKDDHLKGPVLAALREMDAPIPDSFASALKGKDDEVILSVLDGLGKGSSGGWRLALPFVRHANGDIACAAIRIVADQGGREEKVVAELVQVLRKGNKERVKAIFETYPPTEPQDPFGDANEDLDPFEDLSSSTATGVGESGGALADLFASFAPPPAAAPTNVAPKAQAGLQDIFDAFGDAEKKEAAQGAAENPTEPSSPARETIRKLALKYLEPGQDQELTFAATLMLMTMGDAAGASRLAESLNSRTAEERMSIAKRAETCKPKAVAELAKLLLRDTSADVRQAAVTLCLGDASGGLIAEMMQAACEPNAVLAPADLFVESYQWYQALRKGSIRRSVGASIRQVLEEQEAARHTDAQRIAALTLLASCWREGDQTLVERHLGSGNPFVRRAAWHTFGQRQASAFAAKVERVAKDTSEWVRAVVPALFAREGKAPWSIYFDPEHAVDGLQRGSFSSGSRKRLTEPVTDALTALCRDTEESVRLEAALCLLSNREKIDIGMLKAMLERSSEKTMLANRLYEILKDAPASWLRDWGGRRATAFLDAVSVMIEEDDAGRLQALKQKMAEGRESTPETVQVVSRHSKPHPASAPVAREGAAPEPRAAQDEAVRPVVFFRNPGCRDCDRVEGMLKALKVELADLSVEVLNIRNPDHARVNESLCERFGVSEAAHLTAPAVFCGAGALIRNEITFKRLGGLLSRSEATETAWRKVDQDAERRADQKMGERYTAMGPWLVFGAGLLDGVNPCAFATLIFLLSYLQLTRRAPREILAVGAAFVLGVFLAYFVLGLGLVEIVVRFSLLRSFGLILNWGMAAFVACVAILNVWDGVLCLRGRIGDMVLQLPRVLKTRIQDVVGVSSRHRHFVAAAFVAGLAIAVLELACTGQVYAPTLLYMLKTGQGRVGATAYLALYNIAFVVPLLTVFTFAYGGLRSERLTAWLRQHAAFVKFATALLFFALFTVFVAGSLK